MWSLRGEKQLIVGQIQAIDGENVTLALVGLQGASPDGLELLPHEESGRKLARVRSSTLLGRWKRMGVGESYTPA